MGSRSMVSGVEKDMSAGISVSDDSVPVDFLQDSNDLQEDSVLKENSMLQEHQMLLKNSDPENQHSDIQSSEKLNSAFELFNEMSRQLADSYQLLENRVAELTVELNTVTAKRLEELAEKEQLAQRLESLLNVLPGGVIVIDAKGRISQCNPAAHEMLEEQLEGQLWRDVITRFFSPRRDDGHEISTHDGRRYSIATRSLHEGGQIILLTDQTETRRLQAQLSRNERLSALGRMVSALAHQIRTPLSAAMLYAGHLCDSRLESTCRQQFSEKLLKRLIHLERQVQDMLLYVKGELPLNDIVTLAEVERDLCEAMDLPVNGAQLQCQWKNRCPDLRIRCHREALTGALLNLVNNAVQADEKPAKLAISFYTDRKKSRVVISVRDHGPGIAPDLLKNLGELFVTTKPRGTGLGLAIVKTVARAHGGLFRLRSRVAKGTLALLVLPVFDATAR